MPYIAYPLLLAILVYLVLPLILKYIEIPILRRIHNIARHHKNIACPHRRTITMGYYGGMCIDCFAEFGEGCKSKYTEAQRDQMEYAYKYETGTLTEEDKATMHRKIDAMYPAPS